jgi:hypothetical protein
VAHGGEEARDASRLLADASLMVQRCCGVVAEPLFAAPGRHGVVACAECAGLLIVGLSDGWRQEGLGRVRAELAKTPPAPMVLIRGGPRPGGLAPAESRTRFSWSLTAAGEDPWVTPGAAFAGYRMESVVDSSSPSVAPSRRRSVARSGHV